MTDNDELSDAEIVRLVAEKDNRLAQVVQARLRRLRLEHVSQLARMPALPMHWPFTALVIEANRRLLAALNKRAP